MTSREKKLYNAQSSIETLYSDTSVPPESTMEDLEEIIDDCRMKISALKASKTEVGDAKD